MLRRRRNVSWIQRWSRSIIGAIAIVGLILTVYLTITKLAGGEVACSVDAVETVSGCSGVLDSPWAYPFGKSGPPLSLFGSLAYLSMSVFALGPMFINSETNKELKKNIDHWTRWLLLVGGVAMASFSGYLMYVLAAKIQLVCYYCIASALFSLSLLILSIIGHDWDDLGQIFFTSIIVFLVTLVGTFGVYANVDVNVNVDDSSVAVNPNEPIPIPPAEGRPQPPLGWEITTTSGEAEIALAQHLTSIGAVKYGSFQCPHCYDQKQLFGKEAFAEINYIECHPQGKNPQVEKCAQANIRGVPAWFINGQLYEGTQKLQKLAEVSGYSGPTNFKYKMPY
jgi:uncharacterized membrane protein